jgi:hypothetical protein
LVVVPNELAEPGVWHKTSQNRAYLARELPGPNQVGHFLANVTKWHPVLPKDKWGNEQFDTIERPNSMRTQVTEPTGRLRLVRSGSVVFFYTSEGAAKAFALRHKGEFGTKDLKNVRLLGSTGGPGAALDVRVTDLWIRADALLRTVEPVDAPVAIAPVRRWRTMVLALAMVSVAIVLALGAWWYARHRPAAPAPATAAAAAQTFDCPGCGKRLKARSAQSGSRLKCPQCGQVVDVPSDPERPEELS